ncbi:MAG: response regulator [Flavihumibacter sp.]
MRLKTVVIDDEPLAIVLMREWISAFPQLELLHCFEDALSAAEFIRQHRVDLLLVDIQMPDISGLDLVQSLVNKPLIIFTTAHKKFALQGFELDAIDYLLKPIPFERFSKAVGKAVDRHLWREEKENNASENIFVYEEYRLVKIRFSDIVYVESQQDYSRF